MHFELGFVLAGLAGFSLGLVGGGGALLTVPILVYGFHVLAVLGTAYSLFIVGVTSFVGAIMALRSKHVVFRVVLMFAPPAFLGIFLSRNFILHEIPARISIGNHFSQSREGLLMCAFGLVMVLAAILTLRKTPQNPPDGQIELSVSNLVILGFTVGILTGLFGAGGGFLIVPALIFFAALSMENAIGTSLAIIAVDAWFGLASDLGHYQGWDWKFVFYFSGFSLAGVMLGQYFSSRIRGTHLKTVFAWLTMLLGLGLFIKEFVQGIV